MTQQSRISRDERLANLNGLILVENDNNNVLGKKSKMQIQQWLEEAKVLMDKKQKNLQKQERLKQLQQQFQIERVKKQKSIEDKLMVSELNKNKTIETIQQKLGQYSNRHKSVYNKVISEHQDNLEKQMDARKVYIPQGLKQPSREMSQSEDLAVKSKSLVHKLSKQEGKDQIDKKVEEINSKINNANHNQRQRKKSILNRIRQHNTSQIQMVLQKNAQSFEKQINLFSNKLASKFEESDMNKQKYNKSMQKKMQNKKKAYNQKLRVLETNVKHLENEQSEKLDQLNKKMEKSIHDNKSLKDGKNQIYHKKFMQNFQILEQQKVSRADRIIRKHEQIKMKNKVYKEKKDSLFKAIKCDINN